MADPNLQPVLFDPRAASGSFASGCNDREMVADYFQAVSFEKSVKGFAIGLFIGAAACVALTIYVKSKGA